MCIQETSCSSLILKTLNAPPSWKRKHVPTCIYKRHLSQRRVSQRCTPRLVPSLHLSYIRNDVWEGFDGARALGKERKKVSFPWCTANSLILPIDHRTKSNERLGTSLVHTDAVCGHRDLSPSWPIYLALFLLLFQWISKTTCWQQSLSSTNTLAFVSYLIGLVYIGTISTSIGKEGKIFLIFVELVTASDLR